MFRFYLPQIKEESLNFVLKTFDFSIFSSDLVTKFFNVELQNSNAFLTEFNFVFLYFVLLVNLDA